MGPKFWKLPAYKFLQGLQRHGMRHGAFYNNSGADSAARKHNSVRTQQQTSALALARMEFQRVKSHANSIFKLQRDILYTAKQGKALESMQQTSEERSWGPSFQVAIYTVHETEAMLCPRFLDVLAKFMTGQWFPCNPPVSLLEVYLAFVDSTGWLVPINVSGWNQLAIPVEWRSNAASAWLHETSYPELVLEKQAFEQAVESIPTCCQADAQSHEGTSSFNPAPVFGSFWQERKGAVHHASSRIVQIFSFFRQQSHTAKTACRSAQ